MMPSENPVTWRQTTQTLMPTEHQPTAPGQYDIYPAYPLEPGQIQIGFEALVEAIDEASIVVIDGYPGVLWDSFRAQLEEELSSKGLSPHFTAVEQAMLPPDAVDVLIAPYLGDDDPLFGFRFPGELVDFFDRNRLASLHPAPVSVNVVYGTGAALAGWDGLLIYVDVPKNEIQFRARAGSVKNLGAAAPLDPKLAYKRSYFIDWPTTNRHKDSLLPRIDWIVDEQRPDQPAFMPGQTLRDGLARMAHSFFRVRPWFEPGPWGGQWIKAHIPMLAQAVPNYAWSFELIAPENGLLFQSDGRLLEVSFDTLMAQEYQAVLGECAPNFRHEFPIRYDFLDTVDGGNLSVQCHPRPEFIRAQFGETFTQDECYYILDSVPGARVNQGFQAGVDPNAFKAALLHSAQTSEPVDIERFVCSFPVEKHDFVLIPNGTVHGSGIGSLVLEISATPYIFTFKMYDWLRMGLDGKPRSLNIERAFQNLYFDRQGECIQREFVSHPVVLSQGTLQSQGSAGGAWWRVVHLPTHAHHFYDVHRLEFNGSVDVETQGSCHVLSLVEGQTVRLETPGGASAVFNYAETFVVPAAAGRYRLTSPTGEAVKVVKTFVKPSDQWVPGVVPDAIE